MWLQNTRNKSYHPYTAVLAQLSFMKSVPNPFLVHEDVEEVLYPDTHEDIPFEDSISEEVEQIKIQMLTPKKIVPRKKAVSATKLATPKTKGK